MNFLPGGFRQQQGAALLVVVFVIFTLGATFFLGSINSHAVEYRRHQDTRVELEKAKEKLIAYAMNYAFLGLDNVNDANILDEGPGRLPCPDIDNDGIADSNVTDCTDYVRGRLPTSYAYSGNKIDFNDTFSGIDEQFWYVVSPEFKEIATTKVNHLTTGSLYIDGEFESDGVTPTPFVAVIIAPGESVSGQDRSASQTSVSNYLEQGNVSGDTFYNATPTVSVSFNDQVIGIKAADLMLDSLRGTSGNPVVAYEPTRQALYAYWVANSGSLPASASTLAAAGENQGYGWFLDEDYLDNTLISWERDTFYPYVRYKIEGCNTRWYWFIPDYGSYTYSNTYVSGTAC